MDYQAATPFLFTFALINRTFDLTKDNWLQEGLKRTSGGLASALIALQVNPIIRYQTQSQLCKSLAEKVGTMIKNEALSNKNWRQAAPFDINSLLLILDRRNDLITPLVNKWTYYAMIHEFFGISHNRISLASVPNPKPRDPKEMLLSLENDQFFEENYFKNYGELATNLKTAVEDLKAHTKSQHKVETMSDMKRFIDEYPETRRYASNLHNHVFLMSEIARIVSEHNLMIVSECEQEMACDLSTSQEILKRLKQIVSDLSTRAIDALRLVSLFTVCYPNKAGHGDLIKLLMSRQDITPDNLQFIRQLCEFSSTRAQNPLVQQVTRMIVQGVKGVENVLTEYRPGLSKILEDLRKGNKLKETEFAFYGERYKEQPPKRIIVFIVGGVTYNEALIADQINRTSGTRVIVGGTSIHNFQSFMDEVSHAVNLMKDVSH